MEVTKDENTQTTMIKKKKKKVLESPVHLYFGVKIILVYCNASVTETV